MVGGQKKFVALCSWEVSELGGRRPTLDKTEDLNFSFHILSFKMLMHLRHGTSLLSTPLPFWTCIITLNR